MNHGGVKIGIVAAVSTLLVLGAIIAVMLHQFRTRQEEQHLIASRICEYGLQAALQKLSEQPAWTAGFDRVPCEGGWYEVKVAGVRRADSSFLELQSGGHFKSMSETKSCVLAADSSAQSGTGVPWRLVGGICSVNAVRQGN